MCIVNNSVPDKSRDRVSLTLAGIHAVLNTSDLHRWEDLICFPLSNAYLDLDYCGNQVSTGRVYDSGRLH